MDTDWPSVLFFFLLAAVLALGRATSLAFCVASVHWCASDPVVITHDSLSEIGPAEAENRDQTVLRLCGHILHMHMAVKGDRKCREFPVSPFSVFKSSLLSSPFFAETCFLVCSTRASQNKMRNRVQRYNSGTLLLDSIIEGTLLIGTFTKDVPICSLCVHIKYLPTWEIKKQVVCYSSTEPEPKFQAVSSSVARFNFKQGQQQVVAVFATLPWS